MFSAADHEYMTRALRLAEQGMYTTMPNPRVGCVIAKDGNIIGEGFHLRAGEPHAEVHALRVAGEVARDADVYITLEPCSHYGRTPPCTDALIQAGVRRVVAAMQDPNPRVSGQGLKNLASHQIETACGLMEAQARSLNPGFISRMTRGRPFVRSKMAASLDGKTSLANGVSQWITGGAARRDVQHWRARSCAILTAFPTVDFDDPAMTVRLPELIEKKQGSQPLRVVVDSRLKISAQAKILQDGNVLIAYADDPDSKAEGLKQTGAELLQLPDTNGQVCLLSLLKALAEREINEVLVEAGAGLNGALQELNLIDEFLIYYAPILMGEAGKGMFSMTALTQMSQRIQLEIMDIRQVGKDIRVQARPKT
ncbi:MAG TPA: bifunctional diaminohydroxyphosphoribosylaminopyrimidine deaminase/5-amino-6-(5-phosphoribosylamino)uracil reductase RibD [Methylophilaceae bacterium]|nr:bifunctional diaminohydroxyphosphoribosylaminopyrimidine deaminase/5-amino-6-(5-phosphoribosylamino)uracil reductase RibD [Methylophilaceae bacterium]